jgi:hypothetical protein
MPYLAPRLNAGERASCPSHNADKPTKTRLGGFFMIIMKRFATVIALLGFLCALGLPGNGALAQENERGHHRPPPEAYTACEGKSVGDTAEIETPHGDMVTGTCEKDGDRLVLRPDTPPGGEGGPRDNS